MQFLQRPWTVTELECNRDKVTEYTLIEITKRYCRKEGISKVVQEALGVCKKLKQKYGASKDLTVSLLGTTGGEFPAEHHKCRSKLLVYLKVCIL